MRMSDCLFKAELSEDFMCVIPAPDGHPFMWLAAHASINDRHKVRAGEQRQRAEVTIIMGFIEREATVEELLTDPMMTAIFGHYGTTADEVRYLMRDARKCPPSAIVRQNG